MAFGVRGFAAARPPCSFTWDWTLLLASLKRGQIFGRGSHKALFAVCRALLPFLGGKLIVEGAVRLLG